MDEGLRYTMNHLGDILVGGLDRFWGSLTDVLTWRCCRLNRRKREVLKRMGERVSEIQGDSPDLEIFSDEILAELVGELREIENEIVAGSGERATQEEGIPQPGLAIEEGA